MKITVVGAGYVGLSVAILLAQNNTVKIVDIVQSKVDKINSKIAPFADDYIEDYLANKKLDLEALLDGKSQYKDSEYIVIATPTNYDDETKELNTNSIDSTINDIIGINPNANIVIKSTIPIGYTQKARERFATDKIFFSPEFLREGKALFDNLHPSRIVVGSHSSEAKAFAKLLAEAALDENTPTIFTGMVEAESTKLFANTYLAMRVSFFNELDTYAELNGLNAHEIIEAVCSDQRIVHRYNNPSFGYGGYCLPKDSKQLAHNFEGIPNNIIHSIVKANETRKDHIATQIINKKPNIVGIYRLIAKVETDNFRESSIIDIIKRLVDKNVKTVIFEPGLKEECFLGCEVITDFEKFSQISDVIVANRLSDELYSVSDKVYTRDLFSRD